MRTDLLVKPQDASLKFESPLSRSVVVGVNGISAQVALTVVGLIRRKRRPRGQGCIPAAPRGDRLRGNGSAFSHNKRQAKRRH